MLTGVCFYCSNPINFEGRYVEAAIRHLYVDGSTRDSDRRFHLPCLEKFKERGGRPFNPRTEYEVLYVVEMYPGEGHDHVCSECGAILVASKDEDCACDDDRSLCDHCLGCPLPISKP